MKKLLIVGGDLLDKVSAQARGAPRLRKNLNIHASELEPCNRLLNAMEPGTYFPPHCHSDATKDETMVLLRGRMGIVVFDDAGNVEETAILDADGAARCVTIPHGVIHSMVVLRPGTVVLECKAGPYRPLLPAETFVWAPREGAMEAKAYLEKLKGLFDLNIEHPTLRFNT